VLRSHPDFAAFLAGSLIWNISIQVAGPFFNVYLVNELGGTAETVGITAGVMTAFGLLGSLVFGRLSDRKGSLTVIMVTGAVIPLLPILWGITSAPWHAYLVVTLGGFAWAGYNLANFNLLLELAPEDARSRSVALYQAIVFTSAVGGPLLGGALIDAFSYRPVFFATALGRWIGIGLMLVLIHRARSRRTR
jgi:MFS family permease